MTGRAVGTLFIGYGLCLNPEWIGIQAKPYALCYALQMPPSDYLASPPVFPTRGGHPRTPDASRLTVPETGTEQPRSYALPGLSVLQSSVSSWWFDRAHLSGSTFSLSDGSGLGETLTGSPRSASAFYKGRFAPPAEWSHSSKDFVATHSESVAPCTWG